MFNRQSLLFGFGNDGWITRNVRYWRKADIRSRTKISAFALRLPRQFSFVGLCQVQPSG
jgi:hypothetical protein